MKATEIAKCITLDRLLNMLIAAIIVGALAILTAAILEYLALQKDLEADACKQTSSVATGKSVYCGKACWRDEMRVEYLCNSGVKVVIK